jgi:hypothetical protein
MLPEMPNVDGGGDDDDETLETEKLTPMKSADASVMVRLGGLKVNPLLLGVTV